ncbi:hypothetical protein [Paenibacillus xylanilyticus]|uniref:Uncharacterized protein n=1 Tax=Paenibacillus xylanilyticus TaxID=248903 RepID=A0A7Y6BS38_9BACL|nr:hypothetical protein [Paenibacillus xylanilyticus]NUU74008.1 hypothetical protein [Paenibacillus xylanilyticus]
MNVRHELQVINIVEVEGGYAATIQGLDAEQGRKFDGVVTVVDGGIYRGDLVDPRKNSLSMSMITMIKARVNEMIRFQFFVLPRFELLKHAKVEVTRIHTNAVIDSFDAQVEFKVDEFEISGGRLKGPIKFKFDDHTADLILAVGCFEHMSGQHLWKFYFSK